MIKCPRCKSTSKHRMRRKGIVKLIPKAKTFACDSCNIEYSWFPIINTTFKI